MSASAASHRLVLHIPHASLAIPPEERSGLLLNDADLGRELRLMTDAWTDLLFPPVEAEASRVVFPVSRLVVDPERFADDAAEPMAEVGMGAVYTRTSDGGELRPHLSPAERERLLATWYAPHHAALEAAVADVLAREGRCIVVDAHSFSSAPLAHEPDQTPERPDICIGTDPFHTPAPLSTALMRLTEAAGYSVRVNSPFAGALVPASVYKQDKRVQAVMIEVSRRLYMDEDTGERLPGFERVSRFIGRLLEAAASHAAR